MMEKGFLTYDQFMQRVSEGIPNRCTWKGMEGEPYGLNMNDSKLDPAKDLVRKVLFCVTQSDKVLEYCRTNGYDLLVCHHPHHPNTASSAVRIPQIITHTALDCCPGGINDLWKQMLMPEHQHTEPLIDNLGWYGRLDVPIPFQVLVRRIESILGTKILGQKYSTKENISTVCFCSGLGGMVAHHVPATKVDCYITGELVSLADGLGIPAIIETGHTLSERCGVRKYRTLFANTATRIDSVPLSLDQWYDEVYTPTVSQDNPELTNKGVFMKKNTNLPGNFFGVVLRTPEKTMLYCNSTYSYRMAKDRDWLYIEKMSDGRIAVVAAYPIVNISHIELSEDRDGPK